MDSLSLISLLVGIIGTAIAIYQAAIIREQNKQSGKIQFLLAGFNSAALQKQQSWQNQINTLPKLETQEQWEAGRAYLRARDDFSELVALSTALEGVIDVENSAITRMMDKGIEIVKKNNVLQSEGLNNPNPIRKNGN